jgi:hypothetical protein
LKVLVRILLLAALAVSMTTGAGAGETTAAGDPVAVIETSAGDIEVMLFRSRAPETVANFIGLVTVGQGSRPVTDVVIHSIRLKK